MEEVILFEHVKKVIDGDTILNDLTLSIKKGDIYGLLGVNGAGKTTLIKLIFNIVKPTGGRIQVLGKDIEGSNYDVFSKIGSIIEIPVFYRYLSGEENLKIHCDYNNIDYSNIDRVLNLIGLEEAKNKKVINYSLGMRQRLGIARAILHDPVLLILDEPLNALDPKGILEIRNLLLELNKNNQTTMLISSHLISELQKVSNKIGILHEGRLVDEMDVSQFDKTMNMEDYFMRIVGGAS